MEGLSVPFNNLAQGITNVISWITNIYNSVEEVRDNVINGFLELPGKIRDMFSELFELFFVPDEEKMNERIEALRSRFAFIDSLSSSGEYILDFLRNASGAKPPVFTIDLSKKGGQYSWGDSVITIDFAWYAPYKPLVDNIVAGIIWISWLWLMYKRLPEIINGSGMITEHIITLDDRSQVDGHARVRGRSGKNDS